MNISPEQLFSECDTALAEWPFLWSVEEANGLPKGFLLAVGSRETNLKDEIGDGGHGHGVWQLDDRDHVIPSPFPVAEQAQTAAEMLARYLQATGGNVLVAANIYNSGQPFTSGTANQNYGPDVLGRMQAIQVHYSAPDPTPPNEESSVLIIAPAATSQYANKGYWLVSPNGAVDALPANGPLPYFGGPNGTNPSTGQPNLLPGRTITGGASSPTGEGYGLVDNMGDVYAYGDFQYHGNFVGTP
jgi:hypothetical protein